jgi:hypothetical protein
MAALPLSASSSASTVCARVAIVACPARAQLPRHVQRRLDVPVLLQPLRASLTPSPTSSPIVPASPDAKRCSMPRLSVARVRLVCIAGASQRHHRLPSRSAKRVHWVSCRLSFYHLHLHFLSVQPLIRVLSLSWFRLSSSSVSSPFASPRQFPSSTLAHSASLYVVSRPSACNMFLRTLAARRPHPARPRPAPCVL